MHGRDIEARRVASTGREVTQRTWRLDAQPRRATNRPRRPRHRDHTVPLYSAQVDVAALLQPVTAAAAPEPPATQDDPAPDLEPAAVVTVAPVRIAPPAPPTEKPTRSDPVPVASARRRAIRQAGGLVVSPPEAVASAPAVALPPLSPDRSLAYRNREGVVMRALRRVLAWLGLA